MNAGADQALSERIRISRQGIFPDGVGGRSRGSPLAVNGRDVHDGAGSDLSHRGQDGGRRPDRRQAVDLKRPLILFARCFGKAVMKIYSRIIDEKIYRAPTIHDLRDDIRHVSRIRRISSDGEDVAGGGFHADRRNRLVEHFFPAPGDDDRGAVTIEPFRQSAADPGSTASHPGDCHDGKGAQLCAPTCRKAS